MKPIALVFAVISTVGIAGCTAALTDTTTSAELASGNKGAFAVLVEVPEENCNNMLVHTGREVGGGYEYLSSIPMQSELAGHKGFFWPGRQARITSSAYSAAKA